MSTENTDPNTENTQGGDAGAGGDTAAAGAEAAAAGADGGDAGAGESQLTSEQQEEALIDQALADAAAADGVVEPPAVGAADAAAGKDGAQGDGAAGDDGKSAAAKDGAAGEGADEAAAEAEKLGIGKNEAANAKFKELYNKVAEYEKKTVPDLQQRADRYEQHVQHIESTGASPDQYQSALHVIAAVNRGGPAEWAQAREYLAREVAFLDEKLGNGKPGEDVLSGHQDLAEAVEGGGMDRQYAEELARARGRNKATQTWQEEQAQQHRTAGSAQQEAADCRDTLNEIEARLKASDPEWDRKRETLIPILAPIMATLPFKDRPEAFIKAYRELRLPAAAAPAPKPAVPLPTHQPLRPTGGNGQVAKVPTNEMEALEAGLEAFSQSPHAYG